MLMAQFKAVTRRPDCSNQTNRRLQHKQQSSFEYDREVTTGLIGQLLATYQQITNQFEQLQAI